MAGELAGYADNLDADPLRLSAVEERRAVLNHLVRKYAADIDGVLAWAEVSAARLNELEGDDGRIAELAAERDGLRAELGGLAQSLSDARGRRRTGSRRPSPRNWPSWRCRTRG